MTSPATDSASGCHLHQDWGSEGLFREVFPTLSGNILLLTSGKSNSLAASLEILSFLSQNGRRGEVLHGSAEYIAGRIENLATVSRARKELRGQKLRLKKDKRFCPA